MIELSIRSDGPYRTEKNTIPNSMFSTSIRFTVMHTNRFLPDSLCGLIIVFALFFSFSIHRHPPPLSFFDLTAHLYVFSTYIS